MAKQYTYSDTEAQALHLDRYLPPTLVVFHDDGAVTQPLFIGYPDKPDACEDLDLAADPSETLDLALDATAVLDLPPDANATLDDTGDASQTLNLPNDATATLNLEEPCED